MLHATLGEYEQTLTYCEQALDILHECDDPTGTENTWESLGSAHQRLGDHIEAIGCYRNAIEIYRYLGHRLYCAKTLTWLGETHRDANNAASAGQAWQEALAILEDLDDPVADRLKQRLRQNLRQKPANRCGLL